METPLRSAIKAVTYRAFGLLGTTLVAWCITDQFALSASIGVADTVAKVFLYYLFERVWDRIGFGRVDTVQVGREGEGI